MDKPKRGGLRNPSGGRPPLQPEARKIKVSITISQETRDWLKEQRTRPNEPLSQVVERKLQELARRPTAPPAPASDRTADAE